MSESIHVDVANEWFTTVRDNLDGLQALHETKPSRYLILDHTHAFANRWGVSFSCLTQNNFKVWQWAYSAGYKPHGSFTLDCIELNRMEFFDFALEHIPKGSWNVSTTIKAAELGRIEMLKKCHSFKAGCGIMGCAKAASNGYLECLRYLHEEMKVGFGTKSHILAASKGHFECFFYIFLNWSDFDTAPQYHKAKNKHHPQTLSSIQARGQEFLDPQTFWDLLTPEDIEPILDKIDVLKFKTKGEGKSLLWYRVPSNLQQKVELVKNTYKQAVVDGLNDELVKDVVLYCVCVFI